MTNHEANSDGIHRWERFYRTSLNQTPARSHPPCVDFDFQIFCRQPVGGVSRYFASLASELVALGSFDVRIIAPLHVNEYLRRLEGVPIQGRAIKRPPYSARLLTLVNLALLKCSRPADRGALVHQTFYNRSLLANIGRPVVTTIHDLIHEARPQEFSPADNTIRHKREAILRADRIICVSEYTKRDLIERYGVAEDRVSTIYLGTSLAATDGRSLKSPLGAPYLLYVGRRSGYKNFRSALTALTIDKNILSDFRLVCFGGGPPTRADRSLIRKLHIPEGRVLFISGDDGRLAEYYRYARALIFPSLHEGFGLPVLEAMSLGCPVICSATTSVPEVGGDAAVYFDPTNVCNVGEVIRRTVYDSKVLADLKRRGQERARLFSWRKCAIETAEIYKSLL